MVEGNFVKKLIFILLLLLSVGAMAQAMDTTLVVDAQGILWVWSTRKVSIR